MLKLEREGRAIVSRIIGILLVLALVLVLVLAPGPGPASAQQATPSKVADDASAGSLARLLGHLPDLPLNQSGGTVSFADLSQQAAALGLTPPGAEASVAESQAWQEASRTLNLPQSTGQFWALPEWRAAYGFGLEQVDRVAEFSAPPLVVTVVQGRFDTDELRAAWEQGGYQPVDLGDGEAYAVRDDFQIDLADPDARMAMANLNVVALVGDDTLVFSSARQGISAALAATAGEGPSFAQRPDIAPLVQSAPSDLVSALMISGALLQAAPDPASMIVGDESPAEFATRTAEEQAEARALSPIGAALLGQTAGVVSAGAWAAGTATPAPASGAPGALVAILTMGGADAAHQAAQTIAQRLEHGTSPAPLGDRLGQQPWSELFPEREVSAADDAPAVVIRLVPAPGVPLNLLQSMIFQRMPGFLAWSR